MDNSKRISFTATLRVTCLVGVTLFCGAGTAAAAPGDQLGSFDAVAAGVPLCPIVPENIPPARIGTGVAYDGSNLILSCWRSSTLELVSPAAGHAYGGPVAITGVTAGGLGALAWDSDRDLLWACDLGTGPQPVQSVVAIDMATQQVVASPAPFAVPGCAYGVDYDESDGTLWVSNTADESVYHYTVGGVLIPPSPFFTGDPTDLFDGYPNSGVEESCGLLYVSTFDGGEVYEVPKDFSAATLFYPNGQALLSDMARDTDTFNASDNADALWVLDGNQFDDTRNLFAVEITACSNTPPDCTAAAAAPVGHWPPNHKFVPISITGVTDPDGDPVVITPTSIRQDEVVKGNGQGSGNTLPDGQLSPLAVRSERNGNPKTPGNGRVYHIGFEADDGNGGTCTGTVTVCVPHDQRPGATCVDGGPLYNSLVP